MVITIKNSHIGYCTHTTESDNVKVQNVLHGRNNITCGTIVNTDQLQHYIPSKHVFQVYSCKCPA
jgi:hypothetical protein